MATGLYDGNEASSGGAEGKRGRGQLLSAYRGAAVGRIDWDDRKWDILGADRRVDVLRWVLPACLPACLLGPSRRAPALTGSLTDSLTDSPTTHHPPPTGPYEYSGKKLSFDFDQLKIKLGPWSFKFGLKDEIKDYKASKADPFFIVFYVDDDIICARGRGGGIAFWTRVENDFDLKNLV